MAVQIQQRGDTAANWTSADPILADREVGWETDTGKMKLGDGATAWTALAYIGGGGGSGDVVGPASSTDGHVALFDGTTGKLLKDGGAPNTYTGTAGSITLTGSAFSIDATYVGQASITTLGTITTGTWSATTISEVKGGTGQTGYAVGDLLYASSTTALSKLAAGTDGYVLTLASGVPTWAAAAGGGGLTNWTDSLTTAAPNTTTPVAGLTAAGVATNIDAALCPKGFGAICSDIADNTSLGGNKRGTNAVDFQISRTSANHVASGDLSFIGCGASNTASGAYSSVPGGNNNVASGVSSFAVGDYCTADASNAMAWGSNATSKEIKGTFSEASGTFAYPGECQRQRPLLRCITTNNTQTSLTTDGAAPSTSNQVGMNANYQWYVAQGIVLAVEKATGDSAAWRFEALIQRYGTTSMIIACTPTLINATAGASAWSLSVDADTTNHVLRIRGTGETSKTIRWACSITDNLQLGWT